MKKTFLNPETLPSWKELFSQVVVVQGAGRLVFISGQVAVDPQGALLGEGDLSEQAAHAFRNLQSALAAAQAAVTDVVKLTIYVKDYSPAQVAAVIRAAFSRVFQHQNLPTSTWLGVQSLANAGFLIEIEALAALE